MKNKYSHFGFKLAIITLILFITIIVSQMAMFHSGSKTFELLFNSMFAGAMFISLIGMINSLKGLKEPNTPQKILGLIINLGMIILYVYIIDLKFSNVY